MAEYANHHVEDKDKAARLERLSRRSRRNDNHHCDAMVYTKFVRMMRKALPLSAAIIIVVLYLRSGLEEQVITPMEEVTKANNDFHERDVSRNELLNPKFESVDKQDQPYEITAQRAVQGEINKNLIMLERPVGVVTMKDGIRVTMRSDAGAYRQDTQRFFLEGNVNLQHGEGYDLHSEEVHIDLKQGFVWSGKDVSGSGPDISIFAKGVHASSSNGEIFFTGPAKLVLDGSSKGGK